MSELARIQLPNQISNEVSQTSYAIMEKVLAKGDLKELTPKERVELYSNICSSLNLNPLTRPFQYISFDGKLTLYASKDCTEQLRNLHSISIIKIEKEVIDGVFCYTAYARSARGQEDVGTGAVTIKGLSGKSLANAFKIAETQAKRRVTLSICGLGWTDESEIPDVPNAKPINIDFETGEVIEALPYTIEQALKDISTTETEDSLREVFTKAYRTFKDCEDELKHITLAKEKRKDELKHTYTMDAGIILAEVV